MQAAVGDALPDFRRWMRCQGPPARPRRRRCRGGTSSPRCPFAPADLRGTTGSTSSAARSATYSPHARRPRRPRPRRAVDRRRPPRRQARRGVLHAVRRRPLARAAQLGRVSVDSAQTTAHELGHAYHNTHARRAHGAADAGCRWRWPRRPASSARRWWSRPGSPASTGAERLALLDVDLQAPNQVVVDIHCRFLFETEVFARRQRRTLGVVGAQRADAAGPGRRVRRRARPSTAHPYMWAAEAALLRRALLQLAVHVRPAVRARPVRPVPATIPSASAPATTTLLSRAGMDTAEELGAAFGLDVTDEAFWTASLDVLRGRIAEYDGARRRAVTTLPCHPLRRRPATSSPSCSPASRATGVDQVWQRAVRAARRRRTR